MALAEAAHQAIQSQETALSNGAGMVTSVTLVFDIANNGAVIDSRCLVERRGVHRRDGRKE